MATTFTDGVTSSLSPWDDPAGSWNAYNTALAAMFEPVYEIVADQGSPDEFDTFIPGWSVLLNPQTCPAWTLPYCAMFWGTTVPTGTSEGETRALISSRAGFYVGMPAAIIATAQRFLSGTKYVNLLERQSVSGPDPYWFVLVVNASEISMGETWASETLPWNLASGTWVGTDQTVALTTAVNAVVPAGVNWTLVETTGHYWSAATKTWSAETVTWQQADT